MPKTEWVAADILDADLEKIFTGADCVIHLAWLIQPSHNVKLLGAVNVGGTERVLKAVAAASHSVFGIFSYAIDKGYPLALAQTMAMNTLVVLEIFHLFFIRNIHSTSLTWAAARATRVVWAVVLIITAAQFAVTYLPPLQTVLGTRPIPLMDGMLIVAVGAAFFALIEIEKQIRLGLRG